MATIYLGPTIKNLGLSLNQIFTGDLPIDKGGFPPHVKDAVKTNPSLEHQFKDYDLYVAHQSVRSRVAKVPAVSPKTGPPIKTHTGLRKIR